MERQVAHEYMVTVYRYVKDDEPEEPPFTTADIEAAIERSIPDIDSAAVDHA